MVHFDIIRNSGRLLYEYVRGSHLYGLDTPDSDVDTSGVFTCTREELFGCYGYMPQVSDQRHDNTWFEIGELVRLLLKSNPTVLESLFVPEGKVLVKPHSLVRLLIDNREKFLTKECFNPFYSYAKSQISKTRCLDKKIVNPVTERKTPLDFCFTFNAQGSICIKDWLEKHGMYQQYCGLVNIPNMRDTYGLYYDFGAHMEDHADWADDAMFLHLAASFAGGGDSPVPVYGYRGIVDKDGNDVRLSSVPDKDARPVCFMTYNKDGYTAHCRQYKEYQDWVKNRNPTRYESNLEKNYDSKNIMHCFRLMHMAGEIAEGKGLLLERTADRSFLMDVRNHRYEYDEIIALLEQEKERMEGLMAKSTIPEAIDREFVNALMIDIRERQLRMF